MLKPAQDVRCSLPPRNLSRLPMPRPERRRKAGLVPTMVPQPYPAGSGVASPTGSGRRVGIVRSVNRTRSRSSCVESMAPRSHPRMDPHLRSRLAPGRSHRRGDCRGLIIPKNSDTPESRESAAETSVTPRAAGAILYAVFGTSRQISTGRARDWRRSASQRVAVAHVTDVQDVRDLRSRDHPRLACSICCCGVQDGWIAQFLSRAVVTGFLFGAAIDVCDRGAAQADGTEVTGSNSFPGAVVLARDAWRRKPDHRARRRDLARVVFAARDRAAVPGALVLVVAVWSRPGCSISRPRGGTGGRRAARATVA